MEAAVIAGLCLLTLFGVAGWITLDLASDDIAGAFRDALEALRDSRRP